MSDKRTWTSAFRPKPDIRLELVKRAANDPKRTYSGVAREGLGAVPIRMLGISAPFPYHCASAFGKLN